MRMKKCLVGFVVITAVSGLSLAAWHQPQPADPPDVKAMWLAVEQMSRPGAEHKILEFMVGTWSVEMKIDMAAMLPGAPVMTAKGTAEAKWIIGGRFLQTTVISMIDDIKTESLSIHGYDNRKGVYTTYGIDSFGTYAVWADGTFDDASQTFTLNGETEEPGHGKHPFRFVTKITSKDEFVTTIEFKNPENDEWFAMVTNTFVRKP